MVNLILVRHGESLWNKKNLFTGWTDVDLSEKGIEEAKHAGKLLKGISIDKIYTSVLKRAIKTAFYIMDESDILYKEVIKAWQLNERHYGALQGLNKEEMKEKYGEEQVHMWRRSYDTLPPLISEDKNNLLKDDRYEGVTIPRAENLKLTLERVLPYYKEHIETDLRNKKNVLVVAHGNSIRALLKYLENIKDEEITSLEVPTGRPLVLELDDNLNVINKYYLEDE